MNRFTDLFAQGSLVISCQAIPPNPLSGPQTMALMAQAAEMGGADGIRANGVEDVTAIHTKVDIPIIGIDKVGDDGVFITPDAEAALRLFRAGAAVVAMDGTLRERPNGRTFAEEIRRIRERTEKPIMADIDCVAAGVAAFEAGADAVATTLSGYTGSASMPGPALQLIENLVAVVDCPVVAEGRIQTADDLVSARDAGASVVVIGTAITNPLIQTARFKSALAGVVS